MSNSGKGLNRTTGRTERHQHQSWGRTRQPKNLTGTHGERIIAAGAANADVNGALGTLNSATAPALEGYATENQRYLHITCTPGAAVSNVLVYSHAVGQWTELLIGNASVAVAQRTTEIVEISGIDRVAVLGTSSDNNTKVVLAGSTF